MKGCPRFIGTALLLAACLALTTMSCRAAASLTQQIDPPEVSVGDEVVVTFTVQNGSVSKLDLPTVEGLQVLPGSSTSTNISFTNGTLSSSVSESFRLSPSRAGDFTIPAFDIALQDGSSLHTKPMSLHVLESGTAPAAPATATPSPAANATANPPVNANGPVIMPPTYATPGPPAQNPSDQNSNVPRDKDGTPAKVFLVITPQTTDAYVGQSIPMKIDFYIRMDVSAAQNSLPTIKGSDFLMNNFTTRGRVNISMLEGEQYGCETWMTAISAPKSGDFPLSMQRDSYWVKSITNTNNFDPFSGFFNRQANLAHENISSNQLTVHVHPLPEEGRPAHFTGAIGQFKVTGDAQPNSVAVGEPVTLRFSVSGEGNFDYVRAPALPHDPAWKTYNPKSGTNYVDESHTRAVKNFEQSAIPQKNGNLQLPAADFSYFDPNTKQYVTVPIALPEITVTGSSAVAASTPAGDATDSTAVTAVPKADGFLPNRLKLGSTQRNLTPVYHRPWFWAVQGGLLVLSLAGTSVFFFRYRSVPDNGHAALALRRRSQQQEEDVMSDAVRRGDAVAFFSAARHAVQLQLGAQWGLKPEALTLDQIRLRDPALAETLESLFAQADEVIYSGRVSANLDLAEWEHRVRTELLQPQPA
jgi:hypothetical protein